MSGNEPAVTVYTRPGCPYCMMLRRGLNKAGVDYQEVDIRQDPEAAAFVRSVADGNETVPTVDVAGHAMVNPGTAQVLKAVAAHAPDLMPDQTRRRPWWRRRG